MSGTESNLSAIVFKSLQQRRKKKLLKHLITRMRVLLVMITLAVRIQRTKMIVRLKKTIMKKIIIMMMTTARTIMKIMNTTVKQKQMRIM